MDSDGPWLDPITSGRSSKDIEEFFRVLGAVTGVYVAKKRDKNGLKFGFVSFSGVTDCVELEGRMKGVKMGSFKLIVNVARFAAENKTFSRPLKAPEVQSNQFQGPSVMATGNVRSNYRGVRSYSEVLGNLNGAGGSNKGSGYAEKLVEDKVIIVPDRTTAFSELIDVAVVGRLSIWKRWWTSTNFSR
ncbi:putative nucleotide-binding alpha-beta plait domain superfamily, RNA-binding domain superfamily [Helianthus anomalus]